MDETRAAPGVTNVPGAEVRARWVAGTREVATTPKMLSASSHTAHETRSLELVPAREMGEEGVPKGNGRPSVCHQRSDLQAQAGHGALPLRAAMATAPKITFTALNQLSYTKVKHGERGGENLSHQSRARGTKASHLVVRPTCRKEYDGLHTLSPPASPGGPNSMGQTRSLAP
mgnify:CR=1 FL=1